MSEEEYLKMRNAFLDALDCEASKAENSARDSAMSFVEKPDDTQFRELALRRRAIALSFQTARGMAARMMYWKKEAGDD